MLARLVKIARFPLVVALNRFVRWLVLCAVAFAAIGTADAKLVVEQVYSNANGSIQFIVFRLEDKLGCGDVFSVTSIHDGLQLGGWGFTPLGGWTAGHILVATGGFQDLGIGTVDYVVPAGFLGTGAGVIQSCGVEFRYASLPVDGVMALDGSGSPVPNVAKNFAGSSGSVTAAQAAAAGLGYSGSLTGAWYEPATTGQGFTLEVAHHETDWFSYSQVMMTWATFDDSAVGGPERQRWYTLYGCYGCGDDDTYKLPLSLDIYQNTGGNFNTGPITSAQRVGSATLNFTTCERGKLDYTFADGTGRSGSIPLTRLMQNVACYTTGAPPRGNADFALSGLWYDPATSGQGIFVEINPLSGAAFLGWYTYAPGGAATGAAGQRWYTGQSSYGAGARTLAMKLYATTGGLFDAPAPVSTSVEVGTATLTFQSCTAATLDYTFTGGSSAGASGRITLTKIAPTPGCVL